LVRAFEALDTARFAPELELDLVSAAESWRETAVQKRLADYREKRPANSTARWSFALHGGDAVSGRRIFFEKPETQCSRCHQVGSDGGTVGPRLDGIGARQPREYLLESIVRPSAKIAPGFDSVVITLRDGGVSTGIVKRESADELVLLSPDGGETPVKVGEIRSRDRGPSAMPEGLVGSLTRFELRDLIEYLASLK